MLNAELLRLACPLVDDPMCLHVFHLTTGFLSQWIPRETDGLRGRHQETMVYVRDLVLAGCLDSSHLALQVILLFFQKFWNTSPRAIRLLCFEHAEDRPFLPGTLILDSGGGLLQIRSADNA